MRFRSLVLFTAILLGLGFATAGQGQDKEGCKDHPLISRYPGSVLNDCLQKDFDDFTMMLGRNVDGKFSKSQVLEGRVTALEYTAPEGRSVIEVFRNYQGALKKAGFQTLYTCFKDECWDGSSTQAMYNNGEWEHWGWSGFRYLAAKLARPEGDAYVVLLIGGDTPGVVEYVIEVKPMESDLITVDAASLANDITRTGHASVYGIYFDTGKADVKPESDATLSEISKLLQQDAKLKLYVVGHTDNVGTLASNMDLSKRRGDAVVKVLTAKYQIAPARLSAQGDGPTAPVASNDSEDGRAKNRRVELVKQ
jgi:OmpA-OmpF porin, OOP family